MCCDETQCQVERTQPGLPLGVGHIRTATHDYIRHVCALNYLEGKIISRTEAKHTHVEWLRFRQQIDLEIHMADNYGRHKRANVRAWMQRAFSHAFYAHVDLVELGGAVLRRPHTRCRRKLSQCPALVQDSRVLSA